MKKITKALALALILVLVASIFVFNAGASEGEVLIDLSTTWRYLEDGTDPAAGLSSLTAWTEPDFDDSSWKSAAGKFGAKNGAIGSVETFGSPTVLLDHYYDNGDAIHTYFFRTTFNVTNASSVSNLAFDMRADDATLVYINGKLVSDSRLSVPSEASSTNIYYANHTAADKSFWLDSAQLSGVLVEGTNTIAVELHNNNSTSSDIFFALNSLTATQTSATNLFSDVSLTVGSDETQRNITWYSSVARGGGVYYAPTSEMSNGAFPTEAKFSTATATVTANKPGYYSHKATLTDLTPDTDYVLRLYIDGEYSDLYYFSTDALGDFQFTFVGDPQIERASHGESWIDTLNKIKENFGTNLLVSAGDQITTPTSEEQYGYLLVDQLAGMTFAPTIGPSHDSESSAFSEHFGLPNVSTEYGVTQTGANYWYTYNGTLFMHLNMADTSAATNGEHKSFMQEAIAANPDAKWKIAVIHNALYSTGDHSDPTSQYFEQQVGGLRREFAPVLTELGIDIVLSGHDHIYVRSHIMDGDTPLEYDTKYGYIDSLAGTLHIAASSSTGSKFYESTVENGYYVAVENAENRKSAILFSITDESITFKSYFLDDMSVFDTLTIYKEAHVHTAESVDGKDPTCDKTGIEQYWKCTSCGALFADEACTTPTTEAAQTIDALGHDYSAATCAAPKTCQREGCDKTLGKPKDHSWLEPTCTDPYVCENCGATDGEALGHKYANACATDCERCNDTRTPGDHVDDNKDYLCDACSAELEKDSSPIGLIIGISAAALVAIAAVAVVVIIKKKKA